MATKASGVATAAQAAKMIAGPNSVILTIQNGLGAADRIAEAIDTSQVMIGVVVVLERPLNSLGTPIIMACS